MSARRFTQRILLALLLLGLFPGVSFAGGAALTFRKVFKSSYPEFIEIKVSETGTGTFEIRQLDEEASPQTFQVSRALTQKLFGLAQQLHYFEGVDLDVHRRIANLGRKTFRYENGGKTHEVSFNYTLNNGANQLLTIFENLTRQEMDLSDLQRAIKYDRLGVNKILMHVENDYNNSTLPEPESLLLTLDQIGADERILDIARQRARSLAERIRVRR